MKELITHNLTAGWRNILKYKTQNAISVLCLSFGVLCFAIALYLCGVVWDKIVQEAILQESPNRWDRIIFMLFLFCLGISVLVIGMSGYLKMQLQLFLLRTREMSLRRCCGAKPRQLFSLLCAELFIVFMLVAVVSIGISLAFEAYSMPKLTKFGATDVIAINTSTIYRTELWVVLIAYAAAVGIAWLTVRRNLLSPLAKTVGRSFTQRTLWNGTMQVVQYSVAIVLFFVIALFFFIFQRDINRYETATDLDSVTIAKSIEVLRFVIQMIYILTAVCLTSIVLTVYSSISLETRGKQKEVAIRKVNGAKTRNIVLLFSRYYITTLSVSFVIALLVGAFYVVVLSITQGYWPSFSELLSGFLPPLLCSMLTITLVTVLTVWRKIYTISHINPSSFI